ncbi:MAG: glutamine--fructose-6-phosphate transaminase (isomerizing), partial [Candidatus Levybacteria bacterium CG10_big_fil_rev_8_21_14_0_10_36_7]
MCGIFAYIGKKDDTGRKIINGLRSLEYRGYDSWGVAIKQNNENLYVEKHVGKIGDNNVPEREALLGIGHTRWATHGRVTVKNAHPHVSKNDSLAIVHNGIIENFQDIKRKLLKKGYKFTTETDTETLVHLLTEILKKEKNKIKAVQKMFEATSGLNAIIVMFARSEEFIAVKNGSPLVFGKNEEGFFLASDAVALAPHTKNVFFLEDNSLLYFNKNDYRLIEKGKDKKAKFITLPYSIESTKKGKNPHFMIKEIKEQPSILTQITKTQKGNIQNAADLVKNAYGTYLLGCGTAYYATLAATYLFSKIAKRHINAQIGSEFT